MDMMSERKPIVYSDAVEEAFPNLMALLRSTTVLGEAQCERRFVICVDAKDVSTDV